IVVDRKLELFETCEAGPRRSSPARHSPACWTRASFHRLHVRLLEHAPDRPWGSWKRIAASAPALRGGGARRPALGRRVVKYDLIHLTEEYASRWQHVSHPTTVLRSCQPRLDFVRSRQQQQLRPRLPKEPRDPAMSVTGPISGALRTCGHAANGSIGSTI